MNSKKNKINPINLWLERDLTSDARQGKLPRAYRREAELQQLIEILLAGKVPVLVGDSGVGKSAILFETILRARENSLPEPLRGKRVLQFSIRRRAAALRKDMQIGEELDALSEALAKRPEIIPFFRD